VSPVGGGGGAILGGGLGVKWDSGCSCDVGVSWNLGLFWRVQGARQGDRPVDLGGKFTKTRILFIKRIKFMLP